MQNNQKREKLNIEDTVEVHSIFKTIQGEGLFSGHSSIFIRLSGCNLACQQCDTEYTSKRDIMSVDRVLQKVISFEMPDNFIVVITGGEPFRQNITPLVKYLLRRGITVQIETNGTLSTNLAPHHKLFIVVSPKTPKIHPTIRCLSSCYKYVADFTDESNVDVDGLPISVLGMRCKTAKPCLGKPVYIQPTDLQDKVLNQKNALKVAEVSMRFGFIFQLQIHKIVGID